MTANIRPIRLLGLLTNTALACAILPAAGYAQSASTGAQSANTGAQGAKAGAQTPVTLASPDGSLRLTLELADRLRWRLDRKGQPVLAPSPMGLFTNLGGLGGSAVDVLAQENRQENAIYRPVAGIAAQMADRFNETTLHLARRADGQKFDLVLRAYDGGVAFRFVVPANPAGRGAPTEIFWETTGYHFPADYACYGANSGRFENSHETEFDPVKASAMRPFHLYDAPLLCRTGRGGESFAIAEADKRDYAGSYLAPRGDGGLGVQVALSPRVDWGRDTGNFQPAVRLPATGAPHATPWRVVMAADHAGKLMETNLIELLARPSQVADTSWIKPGKAAWDWWNGYAVPVAGAGVNTATYQAYIDFAARMGLDYVLIDEGWYKGSSEGARPADVTQPIAAMDMTGLVAYGAKAKVGLWVWLQWKQLARQMDAALALYESWGIKGIKVDFMDRNDQEMVAFYHELLTKAAKHHLMVDLHGAYPPDGLARTYPHFLTQEGVLGAEYNKFGARITATHNVTLPYTRGLLGPMDYTPGGFRAVLPQELPAKARLVRPFVGTTRGHGLAMYVVYPSPLVMLADSPDAYIGADGQLVAGADFLREVPVTWDETRFLAGEVGQFVAMARRKGARWYLAAMGNEAPRKLALKLDFLGTGQSWRARIWADDLAAKDPNRLTMATRTLPSTTIKAGATLDLALAGSGGAVAVIEPVGP